MKTTILAAALLAALLASVAIPAWAGEWQQLPQFDCLVHKATADKTALQAQNHNFATQFQLHPDPIEECAISDVETAMDYLVYAYRHWGYAPSWMDNHCHAEPAIPENKWVCTEGAAEGFITREYR